MPQKINLLTIGHALIDILVEVDEDFLKELSLKKGQSHINDNQLSKKVLEKIKYHNAKICAGGSAANMAATYALLGGNVTFTGTLGNDEYGTQYEKETLSSGVISNLKKSGDMTGHCIVLITPDAERTFIVNYGAASEVTEHDIHEDGISSSEILHIEGYMLDNQKTKRATLHILKQAKKHNKKVSIDISDPGVVHRNKEEIKKIIADFATIVFANEQEAHVLTGKSPNDAVGELAQLVDIAVVKCGEHGSLIATKGKKIKIPATQTKVIDTTGAGDAYAAGFLYGLSKNFSLEECGNLASVMASKIVSQVGARLTPELLRL